MQLVLDTNVLVSALITPGGLPDQLLQRWEADDFKTVGDWLIFAESSEQKCACPFSEAVSNSF